MVSVIVVTCNRHVMLRLALESLVGQLADFEVVVVNAGTDPLPPDIIPTWLPARIIETGQKMCQSAGINRGLRETTGPYVTIVEDDDTVLPGGLHALWTALEAHPEADAVYSLPQYTDVAGNPLDSPPRLRSYLEAHQTITWADVERSGLFIHGTATMYRRALLERIGGWDETLGTAEEYDAHLRMLHAGATFRAVDAVTVTYRRHPGGKSQDRFRRRRMRAGVMAKIYARLGLTEVAAEAPTE